MRGWLQTWRGLFRQSDAALYLVWAAAWTIASARAFYGGMLDQTSGEWSAPLDDVFIHFDYARSIAQGHPFEWVSGNGYSSGNTSLLYPFVLAVGYAAGMHGESLMVWAAVVAMVSVFAFLIVAREVIVRGGSRRAAIGSTLARVASFLLPPLVLGIGALDWSFWSGMEVALFVGIWGGAYHAYARFEQTGESRDAWLLGVWGAMLVVTRPEAATTIAIFGSIPAWRALRRGRRSVAAWTLVRVGAPAVGMLALQAVANRLWTGEFGANGAVAKLAINHPYLSTDEKIADYTGNVVYALLRNVEYHFADHPGYGVILPALAVLALTSPRTRATALLLWLQIGGWIALVALNGQVRWQNERYTMPAVAWLVLCAVLGVVALFSRRERLSFWQVALLAALAAQAIGVTVRPPGTAPTLQLGWMTAALAGIGVATLLKLWPARAALALTALGLFFVHQAPKMRDQKWFFARASRNIRDQQTTVGRWLKRRGARRVLVGDAGAIMYASELPGLDIIGLGGFRGLPFARAGKNGLASSIELIERLPPRDRPDVMAIFPTWWGVLPVWFSDGAVARFPVEGNVICGGYEHVVYEANWSVLGTGERPFSIGEHERIVDVVDVADVVSEKEHNYRFPKPHGGWTTMRILVDPTDESRDVFDGGRQIDVGRSESFRVHGVRDSGPTQLLVRSIATGKTRVGVRVDGREAGTLELDEENRGWQEVRASLGRVEPSAHVELVALGPAPFFDFHVWLVR